jgi:hypothetical protein
MIRKIYPLNPKDSYHIINAADRLGVKYAIAGNKIALSFRDEDSKKKFELGLGHMLGLREGMAKITREYIKQLIKESLADKADMDEIVQDIESYLVDPTAFEQVVQCFNLLNKLVKPTSEGGSSNLELLNDLCKEYGMAKVKLRGQKI